MILDQGIFGYSASARPRDFYNITQNFLLAKQIEGCTTETIQTYNRRLSQFFRFTGQHDCNDILTIDRRHIREFLLDLQTRKRSPFYIHAHYRALKSFFNWCVAEEFIDRSPLRNINSPRLPRTLGKPLVTEVERDKMLRLCPPNLFLGARDAAIIWLFWSTGVRLNELSILKLEDLNFIKSRIRIFGKGQKYRYVPFNKDAKRAIRHYLSYRRDDLPNLWLTEERTPLRRQGINTAMRRLVDRSGLRGQVKDACHQFRRSWAWRKIKEGMNPEWVRIFAGWETMQMLERYIKAGSSEDLLDAGIDLEQGSNVTLYNLTKCL